MKIRSAVVALGMAASAVIAFASADARPPYHHHYHHQMHHRHWHHH